MRYIWQLTLAVAVLAIASPSQAASTTFFGQDLNGDPNTRLAVTPNTTTARNNFLAGLVGVGTESFESFAGGTGGPLVLNFGVAGVATLSGSLVVQDIPVGTNGVGRYPTDGNKFVETDSNLTITFGAAVAAFGFVGTDIGDFGGQIILTLVGGGAEVININNNTTGGAEGSVLFFGLINNLTFTAITFSNTQPGVDFFGYDQMTVGSLQQIAPVPPSAILMGLGGLGYVGSAWRRRRSAV